MGDTDHLMLERVQNEGVRWIAELSFRRKRYPMEFRPDYSGRLQNAKPSPLALNAELKGIVALVERVRVGESLAFPVVVPQPDMSKARLPSVHESDWVDWTDQRPLVAVWLDRALRVGQGRWAAELRLDDVVDICELEIRPGPMFETFRSPVDVRFGLYLNDLLGMLMRMEAGERFALPFQLRRRWPTPPAPPALPKRGD